MVYVQMTNDVPWIRCTTDVCDVVCLAIAPSLTLCSLGRDYPLPSFLSLSRKIPSRAGHLLEMTDVLDEESGGGVMIVFETDPVKRGEVAAAIEYTTRSLRMNRLIVTEHHGTLDSKTKTLSHPR